MEISALDLFTGPCPWPGKDPEQDLVIPSTRWPAAPKGGRGPGSAPRGHAVQHCIRRPVGATHLWLDRHRSWGSPETLTHPHPCS